MILQASKSKFQDLHIVQQPKKKKHLGTGFHWFFVRAPFFRGVILKIKKLTNLIGEIGLESNRQNACNMLDDISAGGKKIWYSAVVELKTHEEVLSGKLSTNDATLLKIEGC